MTKSTRAKFNCSSVTDHGHGRKQVKLSAVYEGSVGDGEENKRFCKASPSGQIDLTIDNPAAACQFEAGKNYYVDFTAAEDT